MLPTTKQTQVAEPARKRGLDVELQTMARIDRLLTDLTPSQVGRVLAWLQGKYAEVAPEVPLSE